MNTIKLGSVGPDVIRWQNVIGVTADGNFGAKTEEATKAWQRKNKLVPDGVVGPASWSMALGTNVPVTTAKTSAWPIDNKAYQVAKNTALTEKERQYVLTVARGEGFYGNGWGAVSPDAARFGLTGREGVGSNNWGAVQGEGDAGSFQHVDYHANGEAYVGKFKRYSMPEIGFNDMARIILNGGKRGNVGATAIKAAIDKGSLKDAVFAQHANGYFELAPEKYLTAVLKNYQILTNNNDWSKLLSENGGTIAKILGWVGLGIMLLVGGVYVTKRNG
jgi:hypothetical protein